MVDEIDFSWIRPVQGFFAASRIASFAPPTAFWIFPATLSLSMAMHSRPRCAWNPESQHPVP
jgi:hypothetical protein